MRFALLFAALCGCGSVESARDASIDDAASDVEASADDARCRVCPFCTYCQEAEPVVGTPCPENGMQCEYGKDARIRCNRVYDCDAGVWSLEVPAADCPSDAAATGRPRLGTMFLECPLFFVDCMSVGGCGCPTHATPYPGCDAAPE